MPSVPTLLSLTHLIGLALGVGAATVKLILLFRCNTDVAFVPTYLDVATPITRQIIVGQVVLTLSGIGWLLTGYAITPLLWVKIGFVCALWVLGPFMDNVIAPKFRTLAPASGVPASAEFLVVQKQLLTLEAIATGVFYAIILMWVLG